MKPEKYVVSLSGGKDSTAMLLRLLEEKRPVDLILFCDTGLEFPQMYEHLAHLEAYIGRPIIRLKAEHDFEYYFLHYTPKRKNPALEQYSGMSWAGPRNRWCTGILKTRVVDAYLKELRKDYTVIEYVGIAADEPKRIKDKTYPLAEWGMTEKDCLAYTHGIASMIATGFYEWDEQLASRALTDVYEGLKHRYKNGGVRND